MQYPSANSAVWGLNVTSKHSQHPLNQNLNEKQNADNRKEFALLNSLKAEKKGKSRVSRGYWLTRSQGRSRLQEVSSKH